jgi:protease I
MTDQSQQIDGKVIAFLVANEGVERVELTEPWRAVAEAGGQPVLLAPENGPVQSFNHLDRADLYQPAGTVGQARVEDFDGLVLPGGVANPDQLRMRPEAVAFVRDFVASGKPVAAICHAPWILIEADAVRGRRMTSWPSLCTDLRNAGAEWVDEQVVVDGGIVTSRGPHDLPAFNDKLIEELREGAHVRV